MCQICEGRVNCPVCKTETECPDCGGWGYNYEPIEIDGMDLVAKEDCKKCEGTGYVD